jgi:hypothetical protein
MRAKDPAEANQPCRVPCGRRPITGVEGNTLRLRHFRLQEIASLPGVTFGKQTNHRRMTNGISY